MTKPSGSGFAAHVPLLPFSLQQAARSDLITSALPSMRPRNSTVAPIPLQPNSLADLPWWQVFNDRTLTNLIHLALTNNYDVRIAATRRRTGSRPWPSRRIRNSSPRSVTRPTPTGAKNSVSGSANPKGGGATGELVPGGAQRVLGSGPLGPHSPASTKAARAQFLASKEARRGVQLSLITDVAQAYFQLLELDAELENRQAHHQFLWRKSNDLQSAASAVASLPSLRPTAPRALWTPWRPSSPTRTAHRLQENQLNVLLGVGSGSVQRDARLATKTSRQPFQPACLPLCSSGAPIFREAEQLLRSASAQVGVALGEFFPKIGLTALFGGVERGAIRLDGSRRATLVRGCRGERSALPGRSPLWTVPADPGGLGQARLE